MSWCLEFHNIDVAQRKDWKVSVGPIEQIEEARADYWRSLTIDERLKALEAMLEPLMEKDGRRLARVYRIVTVPKG